MLQKQFVGKDLEAVWRCFFTTCHYIKEPCIFRAESRIVVIVCVECVPLGVTSQRYFYLPTQTRDFKLMNSLLSSVTDYIYVYVSGEGLPTYYMKISISCLILVRRAMTHISSKPKTSQSVICNRPSVSSWSSSTGSFTANNTWPRWRTWSWSRRMTS